MTNQKHKVCIVGMGEFSDFFIPLFKDHPDVCEVSIADIVHERCVAAGEKHGVTRMFSSLDDFLQNGKDIDCVAIFTQRQLHGSMVPDCLRAGKHVFSAVPMATSEEEIEQIIELVKETRLTYMTGETCYYFPCAVETQGTVLGVDETQGTVLCETQGTVLCVARSKQRLC